MYANEENHLLILEAWELIGFENKASLQNLITLVTCIENICLHKNIRVLENIQTSINDSNFQSQRRRFGHMIDDVYYLSSEQEMKRLVAYFKPLVDLRQRQESKLIKQKEQEFAVNKFQPQINRKSELIIGKRLDDIYTKVFKKKGSIKKNPKHEQFLINQYLTAKQKLSEKVLLNQSKELPECTFSPTINKPKHCKSHGRLTSPPPHVFLNLYKVAEKRKEKSLDSHRRAKQQQIENEIKECTFKPDCSKTLKATNKLSGVSSKYLTFKNCNSECSTKRVQIIPKKGSNKENVNLRYERGSFSNTSILN